MITAQQFAGMPLLMRRRQVLECGLSEGMIRALTETCALRWVRPTGAAGRRLYLKCSVAPLLRMEMDWSEVESWGALLTIGNLYRAGLHYEDVAAMVAGGTLAVLSGHGPKRFYCAQVAEIVGHQREVSREGAKVAKGELAQRG